MSSHKRGSGGAANDREGVAELVGQGRLIHFVVISNVIDDLRFRSILLSAAATCSGVTSSISPPKGLYGFGAGAGAKSGGRVGRSAWNGSCSSGSGGFRTAWLLAECWISSRINSVAKPNRLASRAHRYKNPVSADIIQYVW